MSQSNRDPRQHADGLFYAFSARFSCAPGFCARYYLHRGGVLAVIDAGSIPVNDVVVYKYPEETDFEFAAAILQKAVNLSRTRTVVIADMFRGIMDKTIISHIGDGSIITGDADKWVAKISPYYRNTNSGNRVRELTLIRQVKESDPFNEPRP